MKSDYMRVSNFPAYLFVVLKRLKLFCIFFYLNKLEDKGKSFERKILFNDSGF
jgi:hypothetical protein